MTNLLYIIIFCGTGELEGGGYGERLSSFLNAGDPIVVNDSTLIPPFSERRWMAAIE